ncbi:hypothetical protein AKJ61_01610 [candidate division MSBL1 archaeon SCGC-AAA259B11]|uniref:Uncharacterized protein n=1 Tax=candidate division MSBL1 archaeon SCGC-AAA259B11 TaxID=1698260 RepID=A0A133U729_9EURY|nr:hypothetical protein AKJ61_01610 [candidate division MSBL1 archaeon SCGC-AAA259B11]
MADLVRGVKAGVLSGVIFGPASLLLIIPLTHSFSGLISIGQFFPLPPYEIGFLVGQITKGAVLYVGIGGVLGFVFAALYGKLLGETPVKKGIIFSVVLWFAIYIAAVLFFSLYGDISTLFGNIMTMASWALFFRNCVSLLGSQR